jgi:hypothetical protein
MDVNKILTQRAEQHFKELVAQIDIKADIHDLAGRYVQEAYTVEQTADHLLAVEIKDDSPTRLIKFNLLAAAGFLASLVGGIAGANNPVILGSVIVSSVASLTGLVEQTTRAEGVLFWAIYGIDGHQGKRSKVRARFNALSQQSSEVEAADFPAALRELIDIGIIEQQGDLLKVADKLVFLWFRE